ncbi:hypothetical protein WT33_14860 [Burkholderia stagnalis]|nr:hypothetical protein WT33_14860 [Burkholderia stagnalis]
MLELFLIFFLMCRQSVLFHIELMHRTRDVRNIHGIMAGQRGFFFFPNETLQIALKQLVGRDTTRRNGP